jgi:hypothetical protein
MFVRRGPKQPPSEQEQHGDHDGQPSQRAVISLEYVDQAG